MAHQRTVSIVEGGGGKDPHAVSLKVLRLSRPSLATQYPLPPTDPDSNPDEPFVPPAATLSYPSADPETRFILSPLLTLPPSFGSAHVGENFSCTLCASVELPTPVTQRRLISNIRILADLQTPTQTIPLDLSPPSASAVPETSDLLQKIVRYDLKEEGSHVLAVTVTYSETAQSLEVDGKPAPASGGRVRTFRKLYQFEAKQCIAVRTKATDLPSRTKLAGQTERCRRFVLEAQLENMSENSISLMESWLTPKPPFKSISMLDGLKHDSSATTQTVSTVTVINPRDVAQISFILEPDEIPDMKRVERPSQELERDGRVILAQLHIKWRTEMGGEGGLNTGWLGSRPKR